MFDPQPARSQPSYSANARSLAARARGPVWLALGLLACLLITGSGLVLRAVFRDRYVPPTPGFGAAAILPTLAPTAAPPKSNSAVVSNPSSLYWTTLMVRQADGSYAPPPEVGQAALARFEKAVDAVNRLPWQPFTPGDLFSPDGQARITQAMTLRDAPGSNFYAVLIPGARQAQVIGCDERGGSCQVRSRFQNVQVAAYDGSTHALTEQLVLPRETTYTFVGQMAYKEDRWVVDDLILPQDGDTPS